VTSPDGAAARLGPSLDSEITWLLHRAAQRMHAATGEQAEAHGLRLRDYLVLSALERTSQLTQAEVLGLDMTTLMSQLDRLEPSGLVVRRPDPVTGGRGYRRSPPPGAPCGTRSPGPAAASRAPP
jgi:hypothetical protein